MSFLYPRLLGSLKQVPVHYYTDGLVIDMFHFNDVHADDPLIIGFDSWAQESWFLMMERVATTWWVVPFRYWYPTTSSKFNSVTTTTLIHSPFIHGDSTIEKTRMRCHPPGWGWQSSCLYLYTMVQAEKMVSTQVLNILRCTLVVMTGPTSKVANHPSNAGNSRMAKDWKGKKHAAKEDNGLLSKKRKQYKSQEFVESKNEDVLWAGHPLAGSSLRAMSIQLEASKVSHNLCYCFNFWHSLQVCDACKSHH